jgi:hypothetical protein
VVNGNAPNVETEVRFLVCPPSNSVVDKQNIVCYNYIMKLTNIEIESFKKEQAKKSANKKRNAVVLLLASKEEVTSELDIKKMYPNLDDKSIKQLLRRIKIKRKELAKATGYLDVKGIQNFKDKGFIYLIENISFEGWVKCGMTTNLSKRLSSYNSYDPLSRFNFILTKEVKSRKDCESILMHKLKSSAEQVSRNEWFKIDLNIAKTIFNQF